MGLFDCGGVRRRSGRAIRTCQCPDLPSRVARHHIPLAQRQHIRRFARRQPREVVPVPARLVDGLAQWDIAARRHRGCCHRSGRGARTGGCRPSEEVASRPRLPSGSPGPSGVTRPPRQSSRGNRFDSETKNSRISSSRAAAAAQAIHSQVVAANATASAANKTTAKACQSNRRRSTRRPLLSVPGCSFPSSFLPHSSIRALTPPLRPPNTSAANRGLPAERAPGPGEHPARRNKGASPLTPPDERPDTQADRGE